MKTVNTTKYFRAFKIKSAKEINRKELKRRYRILAMKYHPDKGGVEGQFRFINDAYQYILKLVKENEIIENKKFFNSKHLRFYPNGSIYDTKTKRWVKFRGKII